MNLTEKDSGRVITLKLDQTMLIQFDSNPSTGFRWDQSETMKSAIVLERRTFKEKNEGKAGSGGKDIWEYNAIEPGQQELRFNYRRAWEKGVAPAQVVTFTVNVK